MWSGSSVATTPDSMSVTRTSGSSSCRSDSDQPLRPIGCRVDAIAGAGGAAGDGGDVDDVATTALELVEEDLGGGDRPHEVDLDHLAVVVALVGDERAEQHDTGVVHEDVGPAQLLPDTVGCRHEAGAVGDVGLDGDGAVGEF